MNIPEGLNNEQVKSLKEQGLSNVAPEKTTKSIVSILFDNFFTYFNILNIILFVLVMITGKFKNGLFIGVLATNTFTGIIQEIRAKRILDKLAVINQSSAYVIREKNELEIPREEVVLGDVLHFQKGSQICVDCCVTECEELAADESMLTGENIPVPKQKGDKLLSGSFVSSGECYAVAEVVGSKCYSAVITAQAKQRKKIHSQILSDVEKFVRFMSFLIIPCGILLFITQMFFSETPWRDNITGTVASMIGMIPNGLVLLITAAYSLGVYKVFKKGVLAQEPAVMEAVSTIDVICFDKTGTLTEPGTNTVRKEIPGFIDFLYKNNIEIKVVSGDKPEYVTEVAKRAGIKNPDNIKDLSGLDERQTMEAASQFSVFCRCNPQQKKWIVKGLQESGKKCAHAGDGVNDVMALKQADCGISPMSGTDAAKGVAGIILLDSDFSVLKKVFSEGRRAINNLAKTACLYFNKTTYSLILTLFTILFTGISNVKYPFEPIHMTVISLFFVGIPSVLITLQNNTTKFKGSFLKNVLEKAIPFGLSVGVSVICLMLALRFGLINKDISFAVYSVAGFMAFLLLYYAGKIHNILSICYTFALFFCFIGTYFFSDFINIGNVSLYNISVTFVALAIAFLTLFITKKSIKF